MRTRTGAHSAPARHRERGQAGILAVVLLVLVMTGIVLSTVNVSSISLANRQAGDTAKSLAEAKTALIAWSASRDPAVDGVNARPGDLPCPDINPLDGYEDGSCVGGALGRVPWKTLGIPEPKDASGETLWYTVASSFRKYNNSPSPITSDTRGDITVYLESAAITNQAVAVIFAPGPAVGPQDRSPSITAPCSAPSGDYPRNLCAINYLESNGSANNAAIYGPFIQAAASSTFNDRLVYITNADLMPLVEVRVARELIGYLNKYRAFTGVYPWGDLGDGNSNASGGYYYNRNRFPCASALPVSWSSAGITLPNWLTNGCGLPPTGWSGVIYYAVEKLSLEDDGSSCSTCDEDHLYVTNSSGKTATECTSSTPPTCEAKVISSGEAKLVLVTVGGKNTDRGPPDYFPNDWPINNWTTITTTYIADDENRDNNDDRFIVPMSSENNRNRIYVVR